MKLSVMGFCGADDSVDPRGEQETLVNSMDASPQLLASISGRYEWVEWGVLFHDLKQGQPKFATFEWLQELSNINSTCKPPIRLAGHLCSKYATDILAGDSTFVQKANKDWGFTRFQLNATKANNVDSSSLGRVHVKGFKDVCASMPNCEFILQTNDETKGLWEPLLKSHPPNLSFLFDESKGLGIVASSYPPPPSPPTKFGYTGGLGPKNIAVQMSKMVEAAGDREMWLDMESSLRTKLADGGDLFDVAKATLCIRAAIEAGLKQEGGQ